MKNFLVIFLIFFFGCATTQKNQANLSISKNHTELSKCFSEGVEYYQKNKFTKARKKFEKLVAIMQTISEVEFEDGTDISNQELVQKYIDRIEPELLEKASSIQAMYVKGRDLYETGRYKAAVEYLARVLMRAPDYKDAIKYISQANIEICRIEEAKEKERLEKEQKRKSKKEKKKIGEYYKYGINLYNKRNMEKAIVEFRKILDINPEHKKAKEYFDKISVHLFDKAKEYYKEGLAAYTDGDIEQAIQLWKEALRLAPDFAKAQKAIERAKVKIIK